MVAHNAIDLTGHVYNRLTVIERDFSRTGGTYWLCKCECGNIKSIFAGNLKRGVTKSCGCYNSEIARKNASKQKHGKSFSPEYKAWHNIKERCFNKNEKSYVNYGARGITMHPDWINSFESFYEHVGDKPSAKHSIDRIDNNGNYEPGNVRWATQKEQVNNQRRNVMFSHNGHVLNIRQWAEKTGLKYQTIYSRLTKYNWPVEKALTEPEKSYR